MKIQPTAIYIKQALLPKKLKLFYDKTSKGRPAWIWAPSITGQRAAFLKVSIDHKLHIYKTYLSSKLPLYLPLNNTSEEMRKFYDKFSEMYDWWVSKNNIPAINFLLRKLKKLKIPKSANVLDLGGGTGLTAGQLIANGYENITIVDFSQKMLDKARKKKVLWNCKFVRRDIRKLNLKNKFDLIVSVFSFGSNSYFKQEDMPKLWKMAHTYLKAKGVMTLFGNDFNPPEKLFKKVAKGIHLLANKYEIPYYIGVKK